MDGVRYVTVRKYFLISSQTRSTKAISIVTVADCAGRPSRARDLSLGRHVRYQFAKEVL